MSGKENIMPTVLRQHGFEIMIYTHDHEPMHVHVFKGSGEIIIELSDISIREAYAMSSRDMRKAQAIVAANQEFLIGAWHRIGPIS